MNTFLERTAPQVYSIPYTVITVGLMFLWVVSNIQSCRLAGTEYRIQRQIEAAQVAETVEEAEVTKLGILEESVTLDRSRNPHNFEFTYSQPGRDFHEDAMTDVRYPVNDPAENFRIFGELVVGEEVWQWRQVQFGVEKRAFSTNKQLLETSIKEFELEPRRSYLSTTEAQNAEIKESVFWMRIYRLVANVVGPFAIVMFVGYWGIYVLDKYIFKSPGDRDVKVPR